MNEELLEIHRHLIAGNQAFASFRLPGHTNTSTYIQTSEEEHASNELNDLVEEEGFIMAPFYPGNGFPYLLVRPDIVFDSEEIDEALIRRVAELKPVKLPGVEAQEHVFCGREAYLQQVEAIRSSIANGAFQKAVLSRIREVEGDQRDRVPEMFQALCREHPNAFNYLFRSGSHFWMGASPEPLFRLRDGKVSTISLAGTRPYEEEHLDLKHWTLKEVLEQEYVTRYIHDVIRSFRVPDYRVSSPYVQKAGNLLHLRTDFSLDAERLDDRLWDFVEAMHPTPAVAGQPKDEAVAFIRELEPHKREYYTGYLGPVNREQGTDLFVNLRCMKITPERLSVFVGGGITLESDAADEWTETCIKAESLLKFLEPYFNQNTN